MAVSRTCTQGRNKSGVVVDVNGAQEHLVYRVCVTQGAANDAIIVDQNEKVILDENHQVSVKCRMREWPAEGQAVETGSHAHALVLVFARAVEFTYQVTLRNEDGTIKQWIKDCTYTRSSQTDHLAVGLVISVK